MGIDAERAHCSVSSAEQCCCHLRVEVVLKGGGIIVYIASYLTDATGKRVLLLPIQPDEVTHADFVFITRIHIDHLDPQTVVGIARASPKASFFTPLSCHCALRECGVEEERIIPHLSMKLLTSATLSSMPSLQSITASITLRVGRNFPPIWVIASPLMA